MHGQNASGVNAWSIPSANAFIECKYIIKYESIVSNLKINVNAQSV